LAGKAGKKRGAASGFLAASFSRSWKLLMKAFTEASVRARIGWG
jgi:hypothetical protein